MGTFDSPDEDDQDPVTQGDHSVELVSLARAFNQLAAWADDHPWPEAKPVDGSLGETLQTFMGPAASVAAIEVLKFRQRDLPHVQLALDGLLSRERRSHELVGWLNDSEFDYGGIAALMSTARSTRMLPGPPRFRTLDLPAGELQCLVAGLYLVDDPRGRWAASVSLRDDYGPRDVRVEVAAADASVATDVTREIRETVRKTNVYRGAAISLQRGGEQLEVTPVERSDRTQIILPDGLLEAIERNTVDFGRQAARLRASGRHIRRGLLFHGPPGTGKSLTVRYLIGQMPERTTVIASGEDLGMIHETFELARALEPATIVLEDVDLIARSRHDEDSNLPALFRLMNEMDGVAPDADMLFILTTNRPEVLESALTMRPGRIDQAVAFPLPDDDCRRRLFELYGAGLKLVDTDTEQIVRRTSGASAAFIRELLRKAALHAALRRPDVENVDVAMIDFDSAIGELLGLGGDLTAKLLGGGPRGIGFVS